MEAITSKSGETITKPEYLKYFLPLDSHNVEKDEDIEAYSYVEEFRFVPFYDQKDKYQSQYVALLWREAFFKRFKNIFDSDKYNIKANRIFDKDAIEEVISLCLNKLKLKSREERNIKRQLSDIYLVCTLEKSSVSEAKILKNMKRKWKEYFDNWMDKGSERRKTLANIMKVSLTTDETLVNISKEVSPTEKINLNPIEIDPNIEKLLMIETMTIMLSLVTGVSNDLNREDLQKFINESEYNDSLWLFSNYQLEFNALPELKELSTTPFMLEVVTNILPILKNNQTSASQIKSSIIVQMGEKIGEIVWFKCQGIVSNLKKFQQHLSDSNQRLKCNKLISDVGILIEKEILEKFKNILPHDIPKGIEKARNSKTKLLSENKDESSIFLNKMEHNLTLLLKRKQTRRSMIYEMFINQYIDREVVKSLFSNKGGLSMEALKLEGKEFSRRLALYMTKEELTKLVLRNRSILFHKEQEIDIFFSESLVSTAARKAAPVKIVNGNVLTFIHKTIQEFHVAEAFFEGVRNAVQDSLKSSFELENIIKQMNLRNKKNGEAVLEKKMTFNIETDEKEIVIHAEDSSLNEISSKVRNIENKMNKMESNIAELLEQKVDRLANFYGIVDKAVIYELSDNREIRRKKSIIENLIVSLEASPCNQLELANESAIIDFIVDPILESDEVVAYFKMLHILLSEGESLVKNRLKVLSDNLVSISNMKLPRRQNKTLLHEAVIEGNEKVVEWAMHVSMDSNDVDLVNLRMDDGRTPIFLAIENDNNDIFSYLLDCYADLSSCKSVSVKSEFNKLSEASFSEARITNIVEYLCTIAIKKVSKVTIIVKNNGYALQEKDELVSKLSIIIKGLQSWMSDLESFLKSTTGLEDVSNEKIKLESMEVNFDALKNLFQLDAEGKSKDEKLQDHIVENFKKFITDVAKILPSDLLSVESDRIEKEDLEKYKTIPYSKIKSLIRGYINSIKGFKMEKFNNMIYEEVFNQTKAHGINLIKEQMDKAMESKEDSDGKYKLIASSFLKHGTIIGRLRQSLYEKFPDSLEADRMEKKINDEGHTALTYSCAHIGSKEQVINLLENGCDVNAKLADYSRTCLHLAAMGGHLELIKFLIEKKLDVHAKDKDNKSCLHLAALGGHFEVVKFLIDEKNCDVHPKDEEGLTSLHVASKEGHLEVVRFLIERNCDVHSRDKKGRTCLHFASMEGQLELVKFLIEKNCDVHAKSYNDRTCLHFASMEGHLEVIKLLIEKNCDVHAKDDVDSSCLHLAAVKGHLEVVKYFIDEQKCDVNAKDGWNGYTCLHIASRYGHLEVVKFLIEKNCDVHAKDKHNYRTCLHFASMEGHLEVVKFLIEKNCDVHEKDDSDKTGLHLASIGGHLEVVKLLIEKNCDVHASDGNVMTCLHFASREGHLEVVKFLIEKNFDVHAKSYMGWTCLHYAAEKGHLEVVKYLIEKNCDVHAKDNEGKTCLDFIKDLSGNGEKKKEIISLIEFKIHEASEEGYLEMVKLLIEKSCDINAKDNIGKTYLHYAAMRGHLEVVKLLIENNCDVNAKDDDGKTCWDYILNSGDDREEIDEIVSLIESKMDAELFQSSIEKEEGRLLQILKENENEIDFNSKIKDDGMTFLHLAARKSYLEVVKFLIEKNCDVNAKDDYGKTCLDEIVKRKDSYVKTKIVSLIQSKMKGLEEKS